MPVRTEHRFPPGLTVPGRGRRRAIPAGDRPARRRLRRPGAAGRDRPAVTRQPSSPHRAAKG